eukprot:699182-Pelagomonas_calceolata.AAC.4
MCLTFSQVTEHDGWGLTASHALRLHLLCVKLTFSSYCALLLHSLACAVPFAGKPPAEMQGLWNFKATEHNCSTTSHVLCLHPLQEDLLLKCRACGFVSEVDPRSRLNSFVVKNPPEVKISKEEKK